MPAYQVPASLSDFISVKEAHEGGQLAQPLFERKYGSVPPDFGRHLIAFYRRDDADPLVASYLHFWQQNRIGLIGGGCTDGLVMQQMRPEQAALINREGGLLRQTLLYAFNTLDGDIDAFFGHCGDARAKEVDLAAGFRETSDLFLLVNWVKPLTETEKQQRLAQALAIGTF